MMYFWRIYHLADSHTFIKTMIQTYFIISTFDSFGGLQAALSTRVWSLSPPDSSEPGEERFTNPAGMVTKAISFFFWTNLVYSMTINDNVALNQSNPMC